MEQARFIQNVLTQELYNDDEVIDSPSLSDCLMYSTNVDPKVFYQQLKDQNHSFDSDDQFEFSSELKKTSMDKNVVFCGKIIPYKESNVSQTTHKVDIKKQHKHLKDRWSFVQLFKKSSTSKSSFDLEKDDFKYEAPISLIASTSKSRWYLLVFGFGSIGHQEHRMHIGDLKKRQNSIRTKDSRDNNKSGGNGGGIWSRSIIRFLGCGGGGGGDNHRLNTNMEIE